jgi:septal ring factor EnvC (AmiA/AmiB activator)
MEITGKLLLLSMLMHLVAAGWNWLEKRNDKTQQRLTEIQTALDAVEHEVLSLKESRKTALTHDNLAEVYKSINQLASTVNQLVGENRSQSDQLRLILNKMTGNRDA